MQARKHLAFGQELVLQHVDMSALVRKRLQRVVNAELFVFDFIDRPHPALSKKADYSVCADFMSRSKCHSFYPCRRSAIERKIKPLPVIVYATGRCPPMYRLVTDCRSFHLQFTV